MMFENCTTVVVVIVVVCGSMGTMIIIRLDEKSAILREAGRFHAVLKTISHFEREQ